MAGTRGRIIGLLRTSQRTVNELAEALALTDNAVRSHLTTLERDGLVQQSGVRAGLRKPHAVYALTAEAESLFPKAYAPVMNQLLQVLNENMEPATVESLLRTMGSRLAAEYKAAAEGKSADERLALMKKVFAELGGLARLEMMDGRRFISGDSCPLAAVSAAHPEICIVVEELVAEVTGASARVCCRYSPTPRCCFEVAAGESVIGSV
jgi:predicted ArsR family transcriptional regulator